MSVANAVSRRRRFRYANELRRGRQTALWNTVALPKPPQLLDIAAVAGGIQKMLFATASAYNNNLEPLVEWSANGVSGWTAVALTGFTAGGPDYPTRLLTTASVAAGAKFFRITAKNTFGNSEPSNSIPITVLA